MPGPIKFGFIEEGLKYYLNKIKPFIYIETVFPKVKIKISDAGKRKEIEGAVLKKHFSSKEYLIILDERGKAFKSVELAERLRNWIQTQSIVTFVIGGPEGVCEGLKRSAKEIISLSNLTLNHEIALLVLVEAIYRSFTIIKGIPYHKE